MKKIILILLLSFSSYVYADEYLQQYSFDKFIKYIKQENIHSSEMQKVIYVNDIANGIIEIDNIKSDNINSEQTLKNKVANYKDLAMFKYDLLMFNQVEKNKIKIYKAIYEDLEIKNKINDYYILTYLFNNNEYVLDYMAKELVLIEQRKDLTSLSTLD